MDKNTEKTKKTEPNDNPETIEVKDKNQDPKLNIDNYGVIGNAFDFQSDIQYLTIIGSIEGHMVSPPNTKSTKYENIIPQLVAIEENPNIKGLLTILNTMGGDVEAGLALAELVTTLSKPTVSLVLGGGHSIGIPLATASHYSFIAESATMTLHPIRMTGLVIGAEPTYEYFRRMQDRVLDFIVRTSRADRDRLSELMNATDNMAADIGTILVGQDAVDLGLIDEVGGLTQALAKLKSMISNSTRVPKQKFKM
jgi:ATP-dependent protease ClpP protease subunit